MIAVGRDDGVRGAPSTTLSGQTTTRSRRAPRATTLRAPTTTSGESCAPRLDDRVGRAIAPDAAAVVASSVTEPESRFQLPCR